MLEELYVENIALIDKLELRLRDGLNILSGETGAGKSIIIDSLNFVLGERADRSLIRYGSEQAAVQAVFSDYETDSVLQYMSDMGIERDAVLILRRKMTVDGKNECRINGRVTTLGILKGLTELLVDIHGQHEHQSLLHSATHIGLLDSLGGAPLLKAKEDYDALFKEYSSVKRRLSAFGDEGERKRKIDILSYQIEEIKNASVEEGEEDSLLAQRKRVRNMEKILSALEGGIGLLEGGSGMSVAGTIKSAGSLLNAISSYDDEIPELADRLDSAKLEIEDISDSLKRLLDKLDFDSRSADKIEQRLEVVRSIQRKYGGSYEAMTSFLTSAERELETLVGADEEVAELQASASKIKSKLLLSASKLTELRKNTAFDFERAMLKELSDLGMSGSTFSVRISSATSVDELSANGADSVEFLISPNKGEPLKPLAKIISGGEMSRFMLALKNILARIDGIGTLVFDEIDAGISGNIAAVVAEKLCNISRARQVIAVTHMPGLAAMADNHYLISKSVEGEKTLTHVEYLEDDTDEVARLIGGDDYSKYAVLHAQEMKAWARRYKDSLKQ